MQELTYNNCLYYRVGEFFERNKGIPEDLLFFYKHLDLDGEIVKIDDCLVIYRYHKEAATFSVKQ